MIDQLKLRDACRHLIDSARTAYLSTVDETGHPHIRAMLNLRNLQLHPQARPLFKDCPDDFTTYFATSAYSGKMAQIQASPKAAAYYCHPKLFRGVMLGGLIEVVDRPELRQALWQEDWRAHFPRGAADNDFTILRLIPSHLQGWWDDHAFALTLK